MAVLSLLAVGFLMKLVAILFVVCAIALVLVVLVQKGKGGGLSSAFGGGAGGGLLGTKTGDFLTWFTIALAGMFIILAIALAKWYRPSVSEFEASQVQSAPAETAEADVNSSVEK
jgi:preprotein translocase subunit SecG